MISLLALILPLLLRHLFNHNLRNVFNSALHMLSNKKRLKHLKNSFRFSTDYKFVCKSFFEHDKLFSHKLASEGKLSVFQLLQKEISSLKNIYKI